MGLCGHRARGFGWYGQGEVPRQQVVDPADEMVGDAFEDLVEVDPQNHIAELAEFAKECRHHLHDDLLLEQPGTNRGTAV